MLCCGGFINSFPGAERSKSTMMVNPLSLSKAQRSPPPSRNDHLISRLAMHSLSVLRAVVYCTVQRGLRNLPFPKPFSPPESKHCCINVCLSSPSFKMAISISVKSKTVHPASFLGWTDAPPHEEVGPVFKTGPPRNIENTFATNKASMGQFQDDGVCCSNLEAPI